MRLDVKIDYTEASNAITDALAIELNRFIPSRLAGLKNQLTLILAKALYDTDEVKSLNGGKLQAELGVPDADQRIDKIIDKWTDSINIDYSPVKNVNRRLSGSIKATAIIADYSDVTGMSEATYDTAKGTTIEWLDWLLLQGDRRIIIDYGIKVDGTNLSRTGLGKIMFKGTGKSWGVPPEFAGTARDNFVTRAIAASQAEIERAFEEVFK